MLKKTTVLDNKAISAIKKLNQSCCQHDNQLLSYPFDDADSHYLFYSENNILISALAISILGDSLAECSAFTVPKHRREGHFSRLLQAALDDYPESDILFACEPHCTDTLAVLNALGAEEETCEYQMEYQPGVKNSCPEPAHQDLLLQPVMQPDGTCRWELIHHGQIIGSSKTTRITNDRIFIHEVLIQEHLRGQGFGQDLIHLLLNSFLPSETIILQVSGDNNAAVALYKKTGFRVTRTLSYYYY